MGYLASPCILIELQFWAIMPVITRKLRVMLKSWWNILSITSNVFTVKTFTYLGLSSPFSESNFYFIIEFTKPFLRQKLCVSFIGRSDSKKIWMNGSVGLGATQEVFWTCYLRSIYILWLRGKLIMVLTCNLPKSRE